MKPKNIYFILLISFSIFKIQSQVPSYIPTNHLQLWMPFSGNANDLSGNGNNGIVVTSTLTTDRFNNTNSAYNFNGSSSHININHNFFNCGWNSWTVSCWINSNSLNNGNNINNNQCVFNTIPLEGFALDFNWGGSNKYALWASTGSGWDVLYNDISNSNISINTWNHMVVIKNNTNYYLYINGILDKTFTNSIIVPSYLSKFCIGSTDSTVTEETFKGKLDDFGIWDTVLTVSQINEVFNSNPLGIKESNIESHFCSIYPNPALQNLQIDINNYLFQRLDSEIKLTVYSVDGRLVKSEKLMKNELQINNKFNIENLFKGIYLLKFSSGNYTQNLKFVKE